MHFVQLLHTLGTAHSDVACPEDLAEVGALHKAELGKDVLLSSVMLDRSVISIP